MRKVVLPEWAALIAKGKVEINAAKMYPDMLEELGFEEKDQYTLNVAQQCAKLDVQLALAGTNKAAKEGGALTILIIDPNKDPETGSEWAFNLYPEGKGAEAATKGREAREHYKRIRGISL